MRQLILQIPAGNEKIIREAAGKYRGRNTIFFPGTEKDVFILFLPNDTLNNFLGDIESVDEIEVNLIPRGVISLYPPQDEAPAQVTDVKPKSAIEIYLGGIQSIGSLFGLVGYSFAAGIIVWIGLYTATVYLLVAAMLIAPLAGPAMNAALATAAGSWSLLRASLARYMLAIGTGLAASYLMALLFDQRIMTPLMIEVSQVAEVAILLPLIGGFAGAVNICQSERDDLVSGAAVGMMVAASLAPPLGLMGVGLHMREWEVVTASAFRIVLQLLGIHLTATLVFYCYGGVRRQGVRFLKGRKRVQYGSLAVVTAAILAMLVWQYSQPHFLRRASLSTELASQLEKELSRLDSIRVVEQNVRFSGRKYNGESIVGFNASVFSTDATAADEAVHAQVLDHMRRNLRFPEKHLHEVYEVSVLRE